MNWRTLVSLLTCTWTLSICTPVIAQSFSKPHRFTGNHWWLTGPMATPCMTENASRVVFDRNDTAHFFIAGDQVSGAVRRLLHVYRTANGTWSKEAWISPQTGRDPYVRFAVLDRAGLLHVLFDQNNGTTTRPFHRVLDTNNIANGWSPLVDIGPGIVSSRLLRAFNDSQGVLHVIYRDANFTNWQVYRRPGGAFSAPIVLTGTSSPPSEMALNPPPIEDPSGRLHYIFNVHRNRGVFHMEADVKRPGVWSPQVNVFPNIRFSSGLGYHLDVTGRLHILAMGTGSNGEGAMFHSYRVRPGVWSTPTMISIGSTTTSPRVQLSCPQSFLVEDSTGVLHLVFYQKKSVNDSERLFYAQASIRNLAAGWTRPFDLTGFTTSLHLLATTVGSTGRVHVFYSTSSTSGAGAGYTRWLDSSGSWSAPLQLTDASSFGKHAIIDGSGRLHYVYRSQAQGVAKIKHRYLNTAGPAGQWSPAVDISQMPQDANSEGLFFDAGHNVHALITSAPAGHSTQTYHTNSIGGGGWTKPVALLPLVPGSFAVYRAILFDRFDTLHLVLHQQTAGKYDPKLWHTMLGSQQTLRADVPSISVTAGGRQRLAIKAGAKNAGQPYILLGSATATAPGFAFGGFQIPLVPDPYFAFTHSSPNQAPLANSLGMLDAVGSAEARVTLPPASVSLMGITVYHACVVASGGRIVLVSNPQTLRLVK